MQLHFPQVLKGWGVREKEKEVEKKIKNMQSEKKKKSFWMLWCWFVVDWGTDVDAAL